MSNTGKQSPLGVSSLAGLLQNKGFWINQPTAGYMGSSSSVSNYTYGTMVSSTALNNLTNAIRQGYVRYLAGELSATQYTNLISIGHNLIPALGNSPPNTYTYTGSPSWSGAGYVNETASYGFFRLFPWQAYNEFNYNETLATNGRYNDFVGSFMNATTFIDYSNQALTTMQLSNDFLKGTYSNMNDLITADLTGVNLATRTFGQDLINLGKALDLKTLYTFGLPSNLLTTIKSVNGLTASLRVALIASGLSTEEINQATDNINVTTAQQQKIYGSFLIITGTDLSEILISLNCNTVGLETLADLLNPKKMFPNSYQSLTVPVYNATGASQPTNSKTYYPIYVGDSVNSALNAPAIVIQLAPVPPPQPPGPAPAEGRQYAEEIGRQGQGGGERTGDGSFSPLTDRDGNPIGDGSGGSWNTPGEAATGDGGVGSSVGYSGSGGGYGFGSPSSGAGEGGGQPGGGGDSCFVEGTLITLADNSKRVIEDIVIGDAVLGLNGINYVLGYDRPLLVDSFRAGNLYGFNGLEKFVTSEHPFMTKQGWKSIDPINAIIYEPKLIDLNIGLLEIGDEILSENGSYITVDSIEHYKDQPQQIVYNLILDGDHTYYANGLLVHNKE